MLTGARGLTHEQAAPSDEWTITHNFGREPVVDVFIDVDGVLTKILPHGMQIVSANEIKIVFTSPRTGRARLA